MASTVFSSSLDVSKFGFTGHKKVVYGVDLLDLNGDDTLDTGLSTVNFFQAIVVGGAVNSGYMVTIENELPRSGTLTVHGVEVTDAGTVSVANAMDYAWWAIGE